MEARSQVPAKGGASPAAEARARALPSVDIPLGDLRSLDPVTHQRAWGTAYGHLWGAGMAMARKKLSGNQWEFYREEIVCTAITQVMAGLADQKSKSFNRLKSFGDLIRMMIRIVRLRAVDFHRTKYRSREDAVENVLALLEGSTGIHVDEPPFTRAELEKEIDRLDPPKPKLFRTRFFDDMTVDETARVHDMAPGTVSTHFAEGFKLLKDRLCRLLA